MTSFGGRADGDLVVLGPSLGTSVDALWERCAGRLTDDFRVVGWDLPGHGRSAPASSFEVADLAVAVRGHVSELTRGRAAWYAGDSLGGAVGFALATDPGPFAGVATIASAAKIGDSDAWRERAALVLSTSTSVMVSGSAERWFAPGFTDREPEVTGRLLNSLVAVDDGSYAAACEALARFDVRDQLASVSLPVLVTAGEHDEVVPPEVASVSAAGIPGSRWEVFADCGHLPPAEDPEAVAGTLTEFVNQAGGPR
jgi:3-oxoadipate enol-lactonase